MERVILFLLNQIVFGMLERPMGEHVYFSPHPVSEYGKIFWQDGEAVGFYTVKKKGLTVTSYVNTILNVYYFRQMYNKGVQP